MTSRASVPRRIGRVVRNIVVFLVLWAALYTPLIWWLDPASAAEGGSLPISMRVWLDLSAAGSILLAAWIVVRWLDGRAFSSLGFDVGSMPKEFAAGLGLGTAMVAITVLPAWLFGWVDWMRPEGFSWSVLSALAAAMMLNTIMQEVMARGYVLQTVESEFGTATALAVSTLFFTALHAGAIAEGGLLPAVNLLAAGLLLGLAYTRTRNLWLPISLHFAWNFVQGPVLGIAVTGQALGGGWKLVRLDGPSAMTGGGFGLEGGIFGTAAVVMAIAVVVRWPGPAGTLGGSTDPEGNGGARARAFE